MKTKTTLRIDERLMARLKREANRRGQTMSALVEAALRSLLEEEENLGDPPPLPRARMGRPSVDIADREALYDAMERG